ncbi:MAG: hypothetical protein ACRD0X_02765 [Thermoanaerobaculia bacterium]
MHELVEVVGLESDPRDLAQDLEQVGVAAQIFVDRTGARGARTSSAAHPVIADVGEG